MLLIPTSGIGKSYTLCWSHFYADQPGQRLGHWHLHRHNLWWPWETQFSLQLHCYHWSLNSLMEKIDAQLFPKYISCLPNVIPLCLSSGTKAQPSTRWTLWLLLSLTSLASFHELPELWKGQAPSNIYNPWSPGMGLRLKRGNCNCLISRIL